MPNTYKDSGGLAQLGERLNGIQEKGIFNVFRKYLI